MKHTGDIVNYVKNDGYPFLCHTGSDALLVAEMFNNRMMLQVEGKWSHVLLEPPPTSPDDAVYIGGSLFVLGRNVDNDTARIIKYVAK